MDWFLYNNGLRHERVNLEIILLKFHRSNFTSFKEFPKYFVGNKAKSRISKSVLQKNKVHQILWKMNISYPLIRTRLSFLEKELTPEGSDFVAHLKEQNV